MRLLCIAAKADPYGYILINGCEIGVTGAARLGSVTEAEAATLLDELERNGVFSRDRKGRAFSRRMVKDAATRAKNTKNGKNGGNPALGVSASKQTRKDHPVNPPDNPPLKAPYPIPHTPDKKEAAAASACATFREKILIEIGVDPVSGLTGNGGCQLGTQAHMAEANRWLELPGITEDVALAEITRIMAGRSVKPKSFSYFTGAMQSLSGALSAPKLEPSETQKTQSSETEQARLLRLMAMAGIHTGATQ